VEGEHCPFNRAYAHGIPSLTAARLLATSPISCAWIATSIGSGGRNCPGLAGSSSPTGAGGAAMIAGVSFSRAVAITSASLLSDLRIHSIISLIDLVY
jgi:hypothetical protein